MNQSFRAFLWTVLLLAVTTTSYGQGWAVPAKTPETPVPCTGCPNAPANATTVGYKAPLASFTGRFLDSSNTSEWFLPFRTARAKMVLVRPDLDRIYFRYGDGTIAAYTLSTFFSRLESGEGLVMPVNPPPPYRGNTPEVFLKWNEYFNPELNGSGWKTFNIDGSLRLTWFDVDDKGYVYIASTLYGWGIVKDSLGSPFGQMGNIIQKQDQHPAMIAVVKGASKYYAMMGRGQMYDVTTRSNPVLVPGNNAPNLKSFAKTTAMDRIAVVDDNQILTINSADGFATGSTPMYTDPSGYKSITTDGTNFYALRNTSDGIKIQVLVPSGSGYSVQASYKVDSSILPDQVHYGEGYLVLTGVDAGGSWDMRVIKVGGNLSFTPVVINASPADSNYPSYFRNYYGTAPTGNVAPGYINMLDGTVYRSPSSGKTYLIVCAKGIGDVYELAGGDSVTTTNDGRRGTPNMNAPTSTSSKVFYGDPVQFTAKSASANIASMVWNFGNPEAGPALNQNQLTGNGQPITYQYSSLTRAGLGIKTVTAASVGDSSIRGQATVTLDPPTARFGLAGTKYLFTQPDASSTAPIIIDDSFVDASDGTVEGHYASWTIDGVPTKTLPTTAVPVGQCGGHSVTYIGFYGPYNPSTFFTSGGNYAVGLDASNGAVGYSVRPFAAAVQLVGSDASTITYASASRITQNSSIFTAAQGAGFTWKWELVNANGASIGAGLSGVGTAAIPNFSVLKSSLNGVQNARVRLTLATNAPFQGACAGLGMESSVALSDPISAPDPVITQSGDCQGAPCTFVASSASGANTSNWTYQWTVTGPANAFDANTNLKTNTLNILFQKTGSFTITITATNPVGTGAVAVPVTVTTAGSMCSTMTNSSFVPTYSSTGGCSPYVACSSGETVTFEADAPLQGGYNPMCAPHTFTWHFPDGQTATGDPTFGNGMVTHVVTVGGTVTVDISNSAQTKTYSLNLTVGSTGGGGGGGGTGGNPCGTMTASNIFPAWTAASGCPGGTCNTGETITFSVQPYNYSLSCSTHNISWTYGDGATGTGQNATHSYASSGAHSVTMTIQNPYQTYTKTFQVTTVAGSTGGGGGSCPQMTTNNLAISYTAASGCSSNNTNTACKNGETVSFDVVSYTSTDFSSCSNMTYTWDFGDNGTATGKNPTHTFSTSGAHNVKVTISNSSQQNFVRALTMTTSDSTGGGGSCGPVGNLTWSIGYSNNNNTCSANGGTCAAGEVINFTVIAYQYDLGCATHTYDWDFGDNSAHATTKDAPHQYSAPGTYTAKCTVNNGSTSKTLTQAVVVGSGGNPGGGQVLVSFVVAPLQGVSNGFLFTPTFTPPDGVTKWSWNFGDGQSSGIITGNGSSPTPMTHVYADDKDYTVTLTAYNNASQSLGTYNHKNEPDSGKRRSVRH